MMRKKVVILLISLFVLACNMAKEELYYNNGNLKFVVGLKNGVRNGQSKQYYESGQLQIESNWQEGLKQGQSISYYKNGKIENIVTFLGGVRHGPSKYYDSLGHLVIENLYEYDKLSGPFKQYYSTGQLLMEGNCKNDLREGESIHYYKTGEVYRKTIYANDTVFYEKVYNKDGNVIDSTLPIKITKLSSDSIVISQVYSQYEKARIGVVFGPLNEQNIVSDTIAAISSKNLNLGYKLEPDQKFISGVVYEIKMPDNRIDGEGSFVYRR